MAADLEAEAEPEGWGEEAELNLEEGGCKGAQSCMPSNHTHLFTEGAESKETDVIEGEEGGGWEVEEALELPPDLVRFLLPGLWSVPIFCCIVM